MRLESEFIRLPLAIDVARLLEEAHQYSEYDWDYHPQRYDGNTALSLVSSGGGRSDSYVGAMQPTPALQQAPYVRQIMAAFGTVIGRSRFMRLAPGSQVPPHSDTDYTWRNRVRIHIPVITDPKITFSSIGNAKEKRVDVHMQAGEAWIFDNWREHAVYNESGVRRIHLVIDTVGSADFWALAKAGWDPKTALDDWDSTIQKIEYNGDADPSLNFEAYNILPVRSPDEIDNMVADFLSEIDALGSQDKARFEGIKSQLDAFRQDWRAHWAMYWDAPANIDRYQSLAQSVKTSLNEKLSNVLLKSNGAKAYDVIANWLDLTTDGNAVRSVESISSNSSSSVPSTAKAKYSGKIPEFDRPVFIVSAPRAGSTIVFETFKNNKELWTIGDAVNREIEDIAELDPSQSGFVSNALTANDHNPQHADHIIRAFMQRLRNTRFVAYSEMQSEFQPPSIRFLEQTPKNALRIPFLKAMFPQAKFIFVYRDARASIASMIEAWNSQRFVTYADLPDWQGLKWSLPLVEGWRDLIGKPVTQIAAVQWAQINDKIIEDLSALNANDYTSLSYDDLLSKSHESLDAICKFAEVPFGPRMQSFVQDGFPHSKYTLSEPAANKWQQYEAEITLAETLFELSEQRLAQFTGGS